MQSKARFHLLCTMLAATFLMATGCEVYNVYNSDEAPDVQAELTQQVVDEGDVQLATATTEAVFQWRPGNPTIVRLRADLGARGVGVITEPSHFHVEPYPTNHNTWMKSLLERPPERIVNGYGEWTLPDAATLTQRAASYRRGTTVMVFFKLGGGTQYGTGVGFFLDINQAVDKSRPDVRE